MKRELILSLSLAAAAVAAAEPRVVTLATREPQGMLNQLLNGGNDAAPIANRKSGGWGPFREQLRELNLPVTRLHDCPLFDCGVKIVDVSMIFANFTADPDNPDNYFFGQTDEYIGNCLQDGTKVLYRLGQSIEHGDIKYFVKPPADFKKWADICSHIIAHYNEGWANGHRWNIEYWEIWNEPDLGEETWGGTEAQFIDLYVTAATYLKARHPNVQIGGPAFCFGLSSFTNFLPAVAKAKAPLDFYSFHAYSSKLDWLVNVYPKQVRGLLDRHGFTQTKLVFDEWHYFPCDWSKLRNDNAYRLRAVGETLCGVEAGAFACAAMTGWQGGPLFMANYYTTAPSSWGLIEPATRRITPSYYCFKAYGRLMRYPERLKAEAKAPLYALAGRNGKGGSALLLSGLKNGAGEIQVRLDAAPKSAKVEAVEPGKDLVEIPAKLDGRTLTFAQAGDSAVFLVTLE